MRADETQVKSFLRWPGGKQWLAHRVIQLVPEHHRTYYEPFVGGASIFFAVRPKRAVLGDINSRLIDTYRWLRDDPCGIIDVLRGWPNDAETYYEVRSAEYQDELRQAAQFIYLNKTCWNGLYRVNQRGQFNVPFAGHGRDVFDRQHLLRAAHVLKGVTLVCCDFQELLKTALAGDFVYLDPPYTVPHAENSFRRYNERLFTWEDQVRLAHTARELADRGCQVVVSNADSAELVDLYSGFAFTRVRRYSTLAADPKRRRSTQEALLVSS